MNYWILTEYPSFPEYHASIKGILLAPNKEIIASPFNKGTSIEINGDTFFVKPNEYSRYGKYTDKLTVGVPGPDYLFVTSAGLTHSLKQKKVKAEYFGLEIIDFEDIPAIKYNIVNLLDKIDCLDEGSSEIMYSDLSKSEIQTIESLVLDESKIPNTIDMFLLDKLTFPVMVVSDHFKNELEKEGFKGLDFCSMEAYVHL